MQPRGQKEKHRNGDQSADDDGLHGLAQDEALNGCELCAEGDADADFAGAAADGVAHDAVEPDCCEDESDEAEDSEERSSEARQAFSTFRGFESHRDLEKQQ